jgi:hypothetical protein
VGVVVEPLLAELLDEFDFMLNFLKLSPCECDELESDGMNFKPTIMSPRYVVTSSKGSLCFGENSFNENPRKFSQKNSPFPAVDTTAVGDYRTPYSAD